MSEELALEALTDFFDAVEAGISQARERIKQKMELQSEDGDYDKLFWEDKQGEKGPFQQTSEKVNGNSELWQQLQAKLKKHKGFMQHKGFRFWFDMKNEAVIDRRKTA